MCAHRLAHVVDSHVAMELRHSQTAGMEGETSGIQRSGDSTRPSIVSPYSQTTDSTYTLKRFAGVWPWQLLRLCGAKEEYPLHRVNRKGDMLWKKAGEYRGQALGMAWWNSEDGEPQFNVDLLPPHPQSPYRTGESPSFQRDLGLSFQTDILKTARICNHQSFSGKGSFVLHSHREWGWQLRAVRSQTQAPARREVCGFLLPFSLSL